MEGHKTNSGAPRSLVEMVNSRPGLDDQDKKGLLELAEIHGLTPTDMQEVFEMMDTDNLPGEYSAPHPEHAKAIDKASREAIAVYGLLQIKRIDRALEAE